MESEYSVHQIESGLHLREGASTTNFALTLPPVQSDLAHQTLKDPYILIFLTLSEEAQEKDLEIALIPSYSAIPVRTWCWICIPGETISPYRRRPGFLS
jgi:predicted nuclease of restriction endonuclease-like (RecB) superfamily